nr:phage integrase family protein [Caballeronia arationis]
MVDYHSERGGGWWRSAPRIGALRARTIVAWLRRREATLGMKVAEDADTAFLMPAEWSAAKFEGFGGAKDGDTVVVIGGDPTEPRLAPFEHLACRGAVRRGREQLRAEPGARLRSFALSTILLRCTPTCTATATGRRPCTLIRANSSGLSCEAW